MRISINWLKDFLDIDRSQVHVIAEGLTARGIEVEAIEEQGQGLEKVIVAQIIKKDKHPDADKLSLLTVDAGSQKLQIVCGASNMKEGDKVALALEGANLPNGLLIKRSKIRGVESCGMCCSESELGIAKESQGIIILPSDAKIGTPVTAVMGLDDVFITLATPPNRGDVLGYLGVAREISAILGQELKYSVHSTPSNEKGNGGLSVEIQDSNCPRYIGRLIKGVKVKPSPAWLVKRIEAIGLRPINNVVDITNYVMFETGHPLHAFDLKHVNNSKIIVRPAKDGEAIKLLDGTDKKLNSRNILICDDKKALAIAGLMGGDESGVDEKTQDIILECACFNPSSIRLSAKFHNINTDSSHRFERGVDIDFMPKVVDRATELFKELCEASSICEVVDVVKHKSEQKKVRISAKAVSEFLGFDISDFEIMELLARIGFVLTKTEIKLEVSVPSFRNDISMKEDLYEEIARLNGFDKIPAELPPVVITDDFDGGTSAHNLKNELRLTLKNLGYLETINYSFVPANYHSLLAYSDDKVIKVKNPIVDTMQVMRVSLVTSLLESAKYNFNHRNNDIKIFEIGKTYLSREGVSSTRAVSDTTRPHPSQSIFEETEYLSGVCTGTITGSADWTRGAKQEKYDFYTMKGEVRALLSTLRIPSFEFIELPKEAPKYLHPGASCAVKCCGTICGYIGAVHPELLSSFDLSGSEIYVFELSFPLLAKFSSSSVSSKEIAKFPQIKRDLSFIVADSVKDASIVSFLKKSRVPNLLDCGVFDLYRGKGIPEGHKSMAYYFVFASPERTLSDSEVDEAMSKIIDGLKREYLINIR